MSMVAMRRQDECPLVDGEDIEAAREMLQAAWVFLGAIDYFNCETGYAVGLAETMDVLDRAKGRSPEEMTDIEIAYATGCLTKVPTEE
jgi:hypothetical protein